MRAAEQHGLAGIFTLAAKRAHLAKLNASAAHEPARADVAREAAALHDHDRLVRPGSPR